jgi:hypothetical protein
LRSGTNTITRIARRERRYPLWIVMRPLSVRHQIIDPNHQLAPQQPLVRAARPGYKGLAYQRIQRPGEAARRHCPEALTVKRPEDAVVDAAQRMRLFEHCLEYRREVARRGVDDPQHLGGCGLLFQCLAGLGDEPGVFHRDHRLGREVLEQRDFFFREWPHL